MTPRPTICPNALQGDSFTPEISGIFSNTFADGKFGVALTASYQERDLGLQPGGGRPTAGVHSRATRTTGARFRSPALRARRTSPTGPTPATRIRCRRTSAYSVNGIERKRTNGQLTLQFRPVESFTATLDYTYSENKVAQQRNELSVWFNFGPSVTSWTDGPVAAPILYSETIPAGNSDLSMGGAKFATKNENESRASISPGT